MSEWKLGRHQHQNPVIQISLWYFLHGVYPSLTYTVVGYPEREGIEISLRSLVSRIFYQNETAVLKKWKVEILQRIVGSKPKQNPKI